MNVIPTVLTFDDGPHAASNNNHTAAALAVLREAGMKGAFFVQTHVPYRGGNSVGASLIRKIHEEGHVVGIHTGSSKDHALHTEREEAGELGSDLKAASSLLDELGIKPRFIRPPTGRCNAAVLATYQRAGLKIVYWDVDSRDSQPGVKPKAIEETLKYEFQRVGRKNHVVVLFHELDRDTRGQIMRYVDVMVGAAKGAGFELRFPTTRREVEGFFEARSDEGVCLKASQGSE